MSKYEYFNGNSPNGEVEELISELTGRLHLETTNFLNEKINCVTQEGNLSSITNIASMAYIGIVMEITCNNFKSKDSIPIYLEKCEGLFGQYVKSIIEEYYE